LRELEIIFAVLVLRFDVLSGEDEKRCGGGGLIERVLQIPGAITDLLPRVHGLRAAP
jgi:hypothetical protein